MGATHTEYVTYSPQSLADCDAALHAVLNLCQWWGNQTPPAFLGDYSEKPYQGKSRITLIFEDCEDNDEAEP
jgi:hypothetical protein